MSNYNCLTMMILRKCRANYEELTSLINRNKISCCAIGLTGRKDRLMFRDMMIDAIFNVWVDHPYFQRPDATIDSVINVLADKFKAANHDDKIFIETALMQAVCACEERAFKDGLSMCIELFNGSIFEKEDITDEAQTDRNSYDI